jgi:hypothetical protein
MSIDVTKLPVSTRTIDGYVMRHFGDGYGTIESSKMKRSYTFFVGFEYSLYLHPTATSKLNQYPIVPQKIRKTIVAEEKRIRKKQDWGPKL